MFWREYKAIKQQQAKACRDKNLRAFFSADKLERCHMKYSEAEQTIYVSAPPLYARYFLNKNGWLHRGVSYRGDFDKFHVWLKLRLDNADIS